MSDEHVAMETPDVEIAVEPEVAEEASYSVSDEAPASQEETKTVDQLAAEVLNGDWGVGQDRRNRLAQAGYDHRAVEEAYYKLIRDH